MTAIIKGSLSAVSKRNEITLAEAFMSAEKLVLIDTSVSMQQKDAGAGRRRYDVASNELARLQAENPGKIAVVSWSHDVRFCPSGIPHDFQGGTDLAGALRFARHADDCGLSVIVISDGEPDEEEEAITVARKFKSRIHTIFIGPEGSPGRNFLRRLAVVSGGQSLQQSPETLNTLSESVKLLTT